MTHFGPFVSRLNKKSYQHVFTIEGKGGQTCRRQEVYTIHLSLAFRALKFWRLKAGTYDPGKVEAERWPTQLAVCVDHGCTLLIPSCDGQVHIVVHHRSKGALLFLQNRKSRGRCLVVTCDNWQQVEVKSKNSEKDQLQTQLALLFCCKLSVDWLPCLLQTFSECITWLMWYTSKGKE